MSHFILHAGTDKTGSTAVQRALRGVRADLLAAGVAMPGLGETQSKHGILIRELDKPEGAEARTSFVAEARALPPNLRRLVTNETIVGAAPEALAALLAEAGAVRSDLYFYVRPHVALYTSVYLQALKNGGTAKGPEDFDGFTKRALRYIPAIEAFAARFGTDCVHVREYGRDILAEGSIVADIWGFMDLPAAIRPAALAVETIANPTPSAEVAALALAFNRFLAAKLGPRQDDNRQTAVFALFRQLFGLKGLPATPFRLPLALQEEISARFTAARVDFAARWFDRPASFEWSAEPLVPPLPPQDLPHDLVASAVQTVARKLAARDMGRMARLARSFVETLPRALRSGASVVPTQDLGLVVAG